MDSVVIPSRGHPLNSFIGLTCGIIQSNFTATWTTPDGSPITASGARGRMTGPNGRLTVVNNAVPGYSDGTTLLIGQLSYLDSGNYTCSATANNVTNSATIQLSLLSRYIYLIMMTCDTAFSFYSDSDSTCKQKDGCFWLECYTVVSFGRLHTTYL